MTSPRSLHLLLPSTQKRSMARNVEIVLGWRQGRTQGGLVGLKTPLELDILQNFITCAKEINCFRILFAC